MGSLTQLAAKVKLLMLLHEDYERSFHRRSFPLTQFWASGKFTRLRYFPWLTAKSADEIARERGRKKFHLSKAAKLLLTLLTLPTHLSHLSHQRSLVTKATCFLRGIIDINELDQNLKILDQWTSNLNVLGRRTLELIT